MSNTTSQYGQSDYYLADNGVEYFRRQAAGGLESGELEARKLLPLIGNARRVLDFGCGGGFLIEVLRRSIPTVCGVEPNPAAREACARRGIEVFPTIGDLSGRAFDAIVSNHCLEHVPYPIQALRELRNHLDDGGTLVLALPIDDWRRQKDIHRVDTDHHLHTWTPVLIRNMLAEAGFSTEQAFVLTYAWPRHWKSLYGALPRRAFDVTCWIWALLTGRRQLIVVARPMQRV